MSGLAVDGFDWNAGGTVNPHRPLSGRGRIRFRFHLTPLQSAMLRACPVDCAELNSWEVRSMRSLKKLQLTYRDGRCWRRTDDGELALEDCDVEER